MLHIEERHYKIIAQILTPYKEYAFHAFGSRSRGDQKRFSDLDLCTLNPIPRMVIGDIKEAFENSNLPYKVDIIDWNRCSEEFRNLIKKDLVPLDL